MNTRCGSCSNTVDQCVHRGTRRSSTVKRLSLVWWGEIIDQVANVLA